MSYASIDAIQNALKDDVFSHAKDAKKAAGRALGTMVEIISYYLLREWGLVSNISIERGLAEYGNPSITHNVEFTLHPLILNEKLSLDKTLPITSTKILNAITSNFSFDKKSNTLLDKSETVKNACTIAENQTYIILASIDSVSNNNVNICIYMQHKKPFAMFECKRVGVEEGNKKGPQTIEKAKQGAYVAQNTSSLQKIRNGKGDKLGIIYDADGMPIVKPYAELIDTIINGSDTNLLKDFTLSVGIVSNHGNWFTSDNQNKELKVLSQSYDWLLFLTDNGLATFVNDLLLKPSRKYEAVQKAFQDSYKEGKKNNVFTKVKMREDAHFALCEYFHSNINSIEKWFNIIAPEGNLQVTDLKKQLFTLKNKDWEDIL